MERNPAREDNAYRIFVSRRERRLWGAALAVVGAIYSTLGIAPIVSDQLRARGLLEPVFGLGVIAIAAAVMMVGWTGRPRGSEMGIWVGIAAAYLMSLARIELAEERTHLIEYSLVAVLTFRALVERAEVGRRPGRPALLAFLITAVVGTIDEVIQAVLPNRVFDLRDITFNVLAGVMAVASSSAIDRSRRRSESTGDIAADA